MSHKQEGVNAKYSMVLKIGKSGENVTQVRGDRSPYLTHEGPLAMEFPDSNTSILDQWINL